MNLSSNYRTDHKSAVQPWQPPRLQVTCATRRRRLLRRRAAAAAVTTTREVTLHHERQSQPRAVGAPRSSRTQSWHSDAGVRHVRVRVGADERAVSGDEANKALCATGLGRETGLLAAMLCAGLGVKYPQEEQHHCCVLIELHQAASSLLDHLSAQRDGRSDEPYLPTTSGTTYLD